MAHPVMGPASIYRLTSPTPDALGRYKRGATFPNKSEAERTRASLLRRTPDAVITLEQAATLDATGHVLSPEQRLWVLANCKRTV